MIRAEESFEFPISAEKSVSILVKTFFLLEITCFWAEKSFEFPISVEKSVSISDQLSHSIKKAPPFPNPGYVPVQASWHNNIPTFKFSIYCNKFRTNEMYNL